MSETLTLRMSDERIEEVNELVENGNWQSRAAYVRAALRQFENKIAAMDPRDPSGENPRQEQMASSNESLASSVTDEQLISAVNDLMAESDKEFVPLEAVVDDVVGDVDRELGSRLVSLSQKSDSPVETDGGGNYTIEVND